jgi:hypothetical protein
VGASDDKVRLPVSQGRNVLVLILLIPVSGLAAWAGYEERHALGPEHWWIPVFPLLAAATVYRLVRRRVPLAMDAEGVDVNTGMVLLGLRTRVAWTSIRKVKLTAGGMLLVVLKDWEGWSEGRPWKVRANMRANHRKTGAAVSQPLRALAGRPDQIVEAIRSVAPVPVEAPEALKRAP